MDQPSRVHTTHVHINRYDSLCINTSQHANSPLPSYLSLGSPHSRPLCNQSHYLNRSTGNLPDPRGNARSAPVHAMWLKRWLISSPVTNTAIKADSTQTALSKYRAGMVKLRYWIKITVSIDHFGTAMPIPSKISDLFPLKQPRVCLGGIDYEMILIGDRY